MKSCTNCIITLEYPKRKGKAFLLNYCIDLHCSRKGAKGHSSVPLGMQLACLTACAAVAACCNCNCNCILSPVQRSAAQHSEVHFELLLVDISPVFGLQSTNLVRAWVVVCGGGGAGGGALLATRSGTGGLFSGYALSRSSSCNSKRCQLGTFGGWVAKRTKLFEHLPTPPHSRAHSRSRLMACLGNLPQYLWLKANVWLNSKD